ncbi:Bardet-Biedl syndrome 4 protein homolog isoform X1 [Thrips palmi]|uniref:Bardet-Biedl syndrome 4 protein homolog isoform X1 n=1 Tax=Thrips palmi TaxID=161013 RepID=A0A6P8YTJ2_THRPL|nr:Bardet-Biedl syndrome 4 protein homolog isoform X1 [Thrips palmi]
MDSARTEYSNGIPARSVPKSRQDSTKAPELQAVEGRNWLLHRHYSRKEFGICKILVQEELERTRGKHEYANYIQGLILRHEGKIQESLECFQICHSLNQRNVDNIKQVARSLFLLGLHNVALEAYLEAQQVSKTPDWDIFHNLGECWLRLGEHGKAKEALRQAVQLGRHERSYIALANMYKMEGEMQAAIDIYKAAVELFFLRASPDSAQLATSLGLLYLQEGKYQHALEKLGGALARDPQCAQALLAAGAMMQNHSDYDVALSKYKIAAQSWPESPALWNNVGMCFYGKKKFVASLSCLKRAHYLSPLDWDILFNLGLVHMATQQYASAFHFLSAAINLKPAHAGTFLLLAITLRHLEDPDNATEAFKQASFLAPLDVSVPLNFAVFLESQGDLEGASLQLVRFQDLAQVTPQISSELLQTSSQLSKSLNSRLLSDTSSKASATGTDANDKSHIEVEAQVRVRNHPIDSSPESEPRNNLADDEV